MMLFNVYLSLFSSGSSIRRDRDHIQWANISKFSNVWIVVGCWAQTKLIKSKFDKLFGCNYGSLASPKYTNTHQNNEKLNQIKIRQMSLLPWNWNQSKQLTDKTYNNMQRLWMVREFAVVHKQETNVKRNILLS